MGYIKQYSKFANQIVKERQQRKVESYKNDPKADMLGSEIPFKVCQCHAVTYCGKECQVADWPRHQENCIPVMVKEYGEKGQGLVAAKDIKMGEQILTDKAMVSNGDMVGSCFLTSDAERLLINLLKDISLLNHSCAPNAAMGLLDFKEEPEKRFELRAVKDISKEEEVTIFYSPESALPWLHVDMIETIQEDFGFDCKCNVCLGKVPGQDKLMKKLIELHSKLDPNPSDWRSEASIRDKIVDVFLDLDIGHPCDKFNALKKLVESAQFANDPILLRKALDKCRQAAEVTTLKVIQQYYEIMERCKCFKEKK